MVGPKILGTDAAACKALGLRLLVLSAGFLFISCACLGTGLLEEDVGIIDARTGENKVAGGWRGARLATERSPTKLRYHAGVTTKHRDTKL